MRFNKQELATLATQPSNKFEKEGVLYVTERQDGFFRRTEEIDLSETTGCASSSSSFFKMKPIRRNIGCMGGTNKVSLERWCRLRGNLLFYFKSSDQFSEPQGVIVLEKCEPIIRNEKREHDGFVFFIEFQDNLKQRLSTNTETEREQWVHAIRHASYEEMRKKLQNLREQLEKRRDNKQDIDVDMRRLQIGKEIDGRSIKKFLFVVGFLLPCIVIIISYSCIYYTVRKQRQKLNKHICSSTTITTATASSKSMGIPAAREREDSRLTAMMLTIFICFLACFLPLTIVNLFDDKHQFPWLNTLASILAWASSVINPFIYAASNRTYRVAYFKLFSAMKFWGQPLSPMPSKSFLPSKGSRDAGSNGNFNTNGKP